jgi:hypothetical protein
VTAPELFGPGTNLIREVDGFLVNEKRFEVKGHNAVSK